MSLDALKEKIAAAGIQSVPVESCHEGFLKETKWSVSCRDRFDFVSIMESRVGHGSVCNLSIAVIEPVHERRLNAF